MYRSILVALDGSKWSDLAGQAAIALAGTGGAIQLIGCHVYAAHMHRDRFEQMEPGLPEQYQETDQLHHLRATHDSLISDGMKLISDAYLYPLGKKAEEEGLNYAGLSVEGRNYVELLRAANERAVDLMVMGAFGQGHVPESQLGGVAERALLYAQRSDVLLVKQDWLLKNRPIVVGIDGSPCSYAALERAATLARTFGATLEGVAVFDPFFHGGVFRKTAEALPPEAAQRFNFPEQQVLHDEIIDQGLERLYRRGLDQAISLAREMGVDMRGEVLSGKVYPKLYQHAVARKAGLVVLGRWGLHRDAQSLIGSNALNLARLSGASTLVVARAENPLKTPETLGERDEEPKEAPSWTPEAEERLKRVPFLVRRMARKAIEKHAGEQGLREITAEVVREAARRFGMG